MIKQIYRWNQALSAVLNQFIFILFSKNDKKMYIGICTQKHNHQRDLCNFKFGKKRKM